MPRESRRSTKAESGAVTSPPTGAAPTDAAPPSQADRRCGACQRDPGRDKCLTTGTFFASVQPSDSIFPNTIPAAVATTIQIAKTPTISRIIKPPVS